MSVDNMRTAVREFFIQNYNQATQIGDDLARIVRAERYERLLGHYMKLGEKNSCKCFNSIDDLIAAMTNNKDRDLSYIKNGI